MNRVTLIAAALVALARPAMAASGDEIRHYRTAFGHRLVCTSNRWANYNPCSRVTLAEVKRMMSWRRTPANKARISSRMPSMATPARSTIDAPTGT
jgi:hypothetical protein